MSKSSNLKKLLSNGFNVPEFYTLNHGFISKNSQEKLKDIYNNLITDTGELAVRSSAYTEDRLELSMAGVYESIIGITSFDDMLVAINQCNNSLKSDRALSLYIEHKIPKHLVKMEIIIQSFKRGKPSGVVFTVDTSKNDKDIMVISGANSICQDFVDGKGEVFRHRINKNRPVIHDEVLQVLITESLKIEKLFNCPQDIEWTYANGELWILQARPLTNLKLETLPVKWNNPGDEKYTWRCELKDVKPLNQEIATLSNNAYNMGCIVTGLSFFYEDVMFAGNAKFLRKKELKRAHEFRENFLKHMDNLRSKGKNIYSDIILIDILTGQRRVEPFLNRDLTPLQIVEFIDAGLKYRINVENYHWEVVHGAVGEEEFAEFKYKYNLSTFEATELISSETLLGEKRRKFSEIVAYIKDSPYLLKIFSDIKYNNLVWQRLQVDTEAEGLRHLIKRYFDDYGLNALSWDSFQILKERPDIFISEIRPRLNREAVENKNVKTNLNRVIIERKILHRLTLDKKVKFIEFLTYLRIAYLVRDNHAMLIDIGAPGYLRQAIINAGEYFVRRGKFKYYDEIEYFTLNEIKFFLINSEANMDLEKRKKEWKNSYIIPDTIGLIPEEKQFSKKPKIKNDKFILNGFSGFSGKITGEVITRDKIESSTDSNLILLLSDIREMDPEPYADKLLGIIFENGSPLEHVGIWAREKGIPVIFSVKEANSILNTGDMVTIDGDNEIVLLIN